MVVELNILENSLTRAASAASCRASRVKRSIRRIMLLLLLIVSITSWTKGVKVCFGMTVLVLGCSMSWR